MAVTPEPVQRTDGVRYRVRFRLAGARNPTSETFTTYGDAQRFIELAQRHGTPKSPAWAVAREIRHGAHPASTIPTLRSWVETVLDRRAATCTPATVANYRRVAGAWLPMLGDWPLDMLTRDLVLRWLAWQRQAETVRSRAVRAREAAAGRPVPPPRMVASSTIAGYQRLLATVLGEAVEDGLIPRNPAKGVRVPRDAEQDEKAFLTGEELRAILAEIPEHWRPLVVLLAGTGMRWSEATALRATDLDLSAPVPVVRITRAWKGGARDAERYLGAPKSAAGVRTVSLPASVVRALRPLVRERARERLLFVGSRGYDSPVAATNFRRRVWRPAVERAGVTKRPRIHDLRHSHISHLIAQGVPLPVIQRRVGHEKITTTVDVYGHLAPDALLVAARATDAALSLDVGREVVEAEVVEVTALPAR